MVVVLVLGFGCVLNSMFTGALLVVRRPLVRIIAVPLKVPAISKMLITNTDEIPALFLKVTLLNYNI